MTRCDIIYALAAYVHPSMYHKVIYWDTQWLRGILAYYLKPEPKEDGGEIQIQMSRKGMHQLGLIDSGIGNGSLIIFKTKGTAQIKI